MSLRSLEGIGDGVQVTYTDGLVTTSVFEQKRQLDPRSTDLLNQGFRRTELAGVPAFVRVGLPTVAVWQSGEITYTVVTDAVPSATEDLLAALPHELPAAAQPSGNPLARGFARVWDLLSADG